MRTDSAFYRIVGREADRRDEWNRSHQIGCGVELELASGAKQQTKTRSPATLLDGYAVVWVDGSPHPSSLDYVTPLAKRLRSPEVPK